PVLYYNIGQSYRRAGKGREAVAAYREYLRQLPAAENRTEVESLISETLATLQTAPISTVQPTTVQATTAPRAATLHHFTLPLSLGCVGTALLVVGAGLQIGAAARYHGLLSGCAKDGPYCSASEIDPIPRLAISGDVFLAVGGALSVAALITTLVR